MTTHRLLCGGLAVALGFGMLGCKDIPASKETQGAVIGGAAGAVTGAVIGGEKNRILGAILGGAVGAAGGYVIGANSDRILGKDQKGVEEASRKSQQSPATPEQAKSAKTADVNGDGFVTLDEVIAMSKAGLSDQEMIDRLRATGQVFDLTDNQKQYLRDQGVSQAVVDQMVELNKEKKEQLLAPRTDVISRPATNTTSAPK